jgi:hypothetical protein
MTLPSNHSDITLNPGLPAMGLTHRKDRGTVTSFASAPMSLPQNFEAAG